MSNLQSRNRKRRTSIRRLFCTHFNVRIIYEKIKNSKKILNFSFKEIVLSGSEYENYIKRFNTEIIIKIDMKSKTYIENIYNTRKYS